LRTESLFTVTIEPCTLVPKPIIHATSILLNDNPWDVKVGERKVKVLPAFTWTHPNRNYLTACGEITYELVGGARSSPMNTYLTFNTAPSSRELVLYTILKDNITSVGLEKEVKV